MKSLGLISLARSKASSLVVALNNSDQSFLVLLRVNSPWAMVSLSFEQ